jgi:two-component system response regulator NreC
MQRSRFQDNRGRKHKILLIHEEGLLRDGLCAIFDLEEDFGLLGVIVGGPAVGTVCLPADPDVVITEFGTSTAHGPDTIKAAQQRWPNAPVLLLTHPGEDEIIQAALRADVDGYCLKTDGRHKLMTALHMLLEKKQNVGPSIYERVVGGYVTKHSRAQRRESGELSEREREVMRWIAKGYRTREIAQQLSLSHKTIEKYRGTLMRKLGLRTATAVAAYAITHGYLQIEPNPV